MTMGDPVEAMGARAGYKELSVLFWHRREGVLHELTHDREIVPLLQRGGYFVVRAATIAIHGDDNAVGNLTADGVKHCWDP